MKVKGLKTTLGAAVVCALMICNLAYSNAFNVNPVTLEDVKPPSKYVPTYNDLSPEDKKEYLEFKQWERINLDTKDPTSETIDEKIVNTLMNDYKKDFKEAQWWSHEIMKASSAQHVSPKEIMAIAAVESTFNKHPKGKVNIGPMQVNKGVWAGKTKYNLYNPSENIQLGSEIYSDYKKGCRGNLECAFKTYNVGPGAYKSKVKLKKQRDYYASIVRALRKFDNIV